MESSSDGHQPLTYMVCMLYVAYIVTHPGRWEVVGVSCKAAVFSSTLALCRPFDLEWWYWLTLTGLFLGCAFRWSVGSLNELGLVV